MKTQEPFKWGFLRWQRMSQKQRTAVFFISTARSGSNDRTIQPQRPLDPAPTTARFGRNDRTISRQPADTENPTASGAQTNDFRFRDRKS